MTWDEIVEKVKEYFGTHMVEFNECVDELDSYTGCIDYDDRYETMDFINEVYRNDPLEALTRAFYGGDADDTIIDMRGDEHRAPFNPNRDYYYYNAYGNLMSTDYKDYSNYLDDWVIKEMYDHHNDLDSLPVKVDKLFQAWEDGSDEIDEEDEDDIE